MKLAIFSPNIFPIPAVSGGAVEELVTYIIEENEVHHKYDIDLYTVDNAHKLSNVKYKYTRIFVVKYQLDKKRDNFYNLLNKVLIRLPKGRAISNFSQTLTKNYISNYYDAVLVEDNRQVFNSIVKKIKHEKLYFHVHDDITPPEKNSNFFSTLLHPANLHMINGIIDSSFRIITVSHYLEERFKAFGAKNTVTLYNAIKKDDLHLADEKKKKVLRKKYNITKSDVVFTYIGRFAKDKGLDRFLSSLNFLESSVNIKILIVGKKWGDSDYENTYVQKLKSIQKKLPIELQKKIIFTGYIDHEEIGNIYSISDCIVIPSRQEAFGMVALEAISMGVPVIASKVGGIPEVLGNSGLLIKNNNRFESNLAQALKKVSIDSSLRLKMSTMGKKRSNSFVHTKKEYFMQFSKIVK